MSRRREVPALPEPVLPDLKAISRSRPRRRIDEEDVRAAMAWWRKRDNAAKRGHRA